MNKQYLGLFLSLAVMGCGKDNSGTPADARAPLIDADPNAPDADLTIPDAAPPNCTPVQGVPTLAADQIGSGLSQPVDIKSPPGDSRIFVVLQGGEIRIVKGDDNVLGTPFLDVGNLISTGSERGLLGLAFHPKYAQNGRFFIYYTATNGAVTLAEGTVSSNPDVANQTTTPLFSFVHDRTNHNGGWIDFGPDGRLYMGTGDGGGGGDPDRNGQEKTVLLGKLLRLDVETPGMAKPAPGNPFIGDASDNAKKVWAYGLRNPWRNSFDRQTGDLYIADVGQDKFEEIDVQPKNTAAGVNYGWSVMEGKHCFRPATGCDQTGLKLPIFEYPHGSPSGTSITGGYVYRGCKMPGIAGTYFYADEAFKAFFSLKWDGANGQTEQKEYSQFSNFRVTTFGQDIEGEILFVDYDGDKLYRLVPAP